MGWCFRLFIKIWETAWNAWNTELRTRTQGFRKGLCWKKCRDSKALMGIEHWTHKFMGNTEHISSWVILAMNSPLQGVCPWCSVATPSCARQLRIRSACLRQERLRLSALWACCFVFWQVAMLTTNIEVWWVILPPIHCLIYCINCLWNCEY